MKIVHYVRENGSIPFSLWFNGLKDCRAKIAIERRLDRAGQGNFGDHKSVGGGIWELRIDFGPGYRVYYFINGDELVVLLCGGDKSTQEADIRKAVEYKDDFLRRHL